MAKRRKLSTVTVSQRSGSLSQEQGAIQQSNEIQSEASFSEVQEQAVGTAVEIEPEYTVLEPQEELRSDKRTRGATVMADVWELEPNKKIRVQLDSYGLPIGSEGCTLTSFLGTVARSSLYAPINYYDWRKMPLKKKEEMWELVQTKFSFEPPATKKTKSWILTDLNDKWRTWKNTLKSKVFNSSLTLEQMVENLDDARADKGQLKSLVKFWLTDEAERISKINKVNKRKSKERHAAGTKSFARIIHEETLRNNGRRPSRAGIYIKTRYSTKSGDYVTPEAAEIAEAMKADLGAIDPTQASEDNDTRIEDVYSGFKGSEKKRLVRCIGKISILRDIGTSEQRNKGTREQIAELENKVACLFVAFKQIHPDFSLDALQAMTAHGQTAEAERRSQCQQEKIEELEAQLSEAEGIIIDLREELRQVQDELEKTKYNQISLLSKHSMHEEEVAMSTSEHNEDGQLYLSSQKIAGIDHERYCPTYISVSEDPVPVAQKTISQNLVVRSHPEEPASSGLSNCEDPSTLSSSDLDEKDRKILEQPETKMMDDNKCFSQAKRAGCRRPRKNVKSQEAITTLRPRVLSSSLQMGFQPRYKSDDCSKR